MGNIGQIARGWLDAWRTAGLNPLVTYWQLAERRRYAALAWWKRSPGLMTVALVLSLYATCRVLFLAWQVLQTDSSAGYLALSTISGVMLIVMSAMVFAWIWLLARFSVVAQFALGFLERQPRRRMRQTLDDMQAASALSEQSILVGVGNYVLRQILPPLLLLSFLRIAVMLYKDAAFASWQSIGASLGSALLLLFYLVLAGCLAAQALAFLMVSLSLVDRAGIMPGIGAFVQQLMQGLLPIGAFVAFELSREQNDSEFTLLTSLSYIAVLLLMIGLLLYLARRLDWMRGALAYAFPLVLAFIVLIVAGSQIFSSDIQYCNAAIAASCWTAQILSITAPLPAMGFHFLAFNQTAPSISGSYGELGLLLLAQVVFAFICAEFARDAIRRRKWARGNVE